MNVSMSDLKEAERIAKAQRIAAAKWLQVDESKVTSPKAMMLIHEGLASVKLGAAHISQASDPFARKYARTLPEGRVFRLLLPILAHQFRP
jgi:hypothetical protein